MRQEFLGVGAKSATEVGQDQTGSDPNTAGGAGGAGSGYLFLLFPSLTWQANVSEFRFGSLFPGGFL